MGATSSDHFCPYCRSKRRPHTHSIGFASPEEVTTRSLIRRSSTLRSPPGVQIRVPFRKHIGAATITAPPLTRARKLAAYRKATNTKAIAADSSRLLQNQHSRDDRPQGGMREKKACERWAIFSGRQQVSRPIKPTF